MDGSLQGQWKANLESFLVYLEQGLVSGAKGLVLDKAGTAFGKGATVEVEGVDKTVEVTDRGEYWRLLAPGKYRVGYCDFFSTCVT